MYPGKGTVVLIRPARTFYERIMIRQTQESYRESFKADLLEQCKMYVQSAENVSARRVASNRYLLTINAALVALYGLQSRIFSARAIGRCLSPL